MLILRSCDAPQILAARRPCVPPLSMLMAGGRGVKGGGGDGGVKHGVWREMEGSVTATVPLPRAGHQHSTTPRPHHPTSTPRPHHPTSTPGPRAHSHSINTMWTKSTRMANNKAPTTRARDSTEPSNVYDWAALTTTSLSDVTGDYMLEGGGGFLVSPTGVSPWRFLSQVGEVVTGVLHTGGGSITMDPSHRWGSITGVLHTGGGSITGVLHTQLEVYHYGSFTQVEVYHRGPSHRWRSITGPFTQVEGLSPGSFTRGGCLSLWVICTDGGDCH